jgi:hypothetical protein
VAIIQIRTPGFDIKKTPKLFKNSLGLIKSLRKTLKSRVKLTLKLLFPLVLFGVVRNRESVCFISDRTIRYNYTVYYTEVGGPQMSSANR